MFELRRDRRAPAILPVVDNNQYELSDAMKRYINSKDSKYNVNQIAIRQVVTILSPARWYWLDGD